MMGWSLDVRLLADPRKQRSEERKRQDDLAFIAWCRSATLPELIDKLSRYIDTHRSPGFPLWKLEAVRRAVQYWPTFGAVCRADLVVFRTVVCAIGIVKRRARFMDEELSESK